MTYDWVRKGQTKLSMYSVFGEQIKSLSSNQSKLNFWNRLHPKFALLCRFLTQTATWWPNHPILASSDQSNSESYDQHSFFGTKFMGGQNFYLHWEVFTTRERTLGLTGWTFSYTILKMLACPSYRWFGLGFERYRIFVSKPRVGILIPFLDWKKIWLPRQLSLSHK